LITITELDVAVAEALDETPAGADAVDEVVFDDPELHAASNAPADRARHVQRRNLMFVMSHVRVSGRKRIPEAAPLGVAGVETIQSVSRNEPQRMFGPNS
jgi:hypothetical protein